MGDRNEYCTDVNSRCNLTLFRRAWLCTQVQRSATAPTPAARKEVKDSLNLMTKKEESPDHQVFYKTRHAAQFKVVINASSGENNVPSTAGLVFSEHH
jgi:hypothetical protein